MQPGTLLKTCADATKFQQLEETLFEGSQRLYGEVRDEFRLHMTALLQAEAGARAELMQQAQAAVQKVEQTRKTTKKRAAPNRTPDQDPELDQQIRQEFGQVKNGLGQEVAAIEEQQGKLDEAARRYSAVVARCISNARAIVSHHTGFTLQSDATEQPPDEEQTSP